MASESRAVQLVEVGPRDGLQMERVLPTAMKIEYVNRAVEAGIKRVEVASFVNPKVVPQAADAEAVVAGLPKRDDVEYIGLVLNGRGMERAVAAGVDMVTFGMGVTSAHNQENQHASVPESLDQLGRIADLARREGIKLSVMLGVAFGCAIEGEVAVDEVADLVRRVMEFKPAEIGLGDTIGVAVPSDVTERVAAIKGIVGDVPLRCHFHNTRNTGFANAVAAVLAGVTALDSSLGGIGGCPIVPRAVGNIASEDLVYLLERMNVSHGVSLESLLAAVPWLEEQLQHSVPGMLSKAGPFPVAALSGAPA